MARDVGRQRLRRTLVCGMRKDLDLDLGKVRAVADDDPGPLVRAADVDVGQAFGDFRLAQPVRADVDLEARAWDERREVGDEVAIEQMVHLARHPGKEVAARIADLDRKAGRGAFVVVERARALRQVCLFFVDGGHRATGPTVPIADALERRLVAQHAGSAGDPQRPAR